MSLVFYSRGSSATPYEITVDRHDDIAMMRCDCAAGKQGQPCKHRLALLAGDTTALEGGDDPTKIMNLIDGSELHRALLEWQRAEQEVEEAKGRASRWRHAVGRLMN
jgi:uncharacterized Zn finger protein